MSKFKVGDKVKANGGYTFDPIEGVIVAIRDDVAEVKILKEQYTSYRSHKNEVWAYWERDIEKLYRKEYNMFKEIM